MKNGLEFLQDEDGATVIEYALIAAFIGTAIVSVLTMVSGSLVDVFTMINTKFGEILN